MAEAGPSRVRQLRKLGSSSDDIEVLDTDAVPLAARRRGRKPNSSKPSAKSKAAAAEDTEGSSDEVVFVAASLAKKYSYSAKTAAIAKPRRPIKVGSPPRQRSESVKLDEGGELREEKKILKPLVLKPPLEIPKASPPPPHWLGRTAVLVPLVACPVCLNAFRKADSGAARWVNMMSKADECER